MLLWSMAAFTLALVVSTALRLWALAADYLIVKSCLGHAHVWLGGVKSQVGEELEVDLFRILQQDVVLLIR